MLKQKSYLTMRIYYGKKLSRVYFSSDHTATERLRVKEK